MGFPGVLVVKNQPAKAGDVRDSGSIPDQKDSLEGGMATHSSISCLENPMDRGAQWATVHRVAKSRTRQVTWHASTHAHKVTLYNTGNIRTITGV